MSGVVVDEVRAARSHSLRISGALVLIALICIAGCATQPVPDSATTPVPRDRIRHPAYLEAAPGTGEVSVKRDAGFVGSGCLAVLLVDRVPAAELKPSERVVLHIPAGDHVLSVTDTGRGLCRWVSVPEVSAHVTVGEPQAFRIGGGSGGAVISPTAF